MIRKLTTYFRTRTTVFFLYLDRIIMQSGKATEQKFYGK